MAEEEHLQIERKLVGRGGVMLLITGVLDAGCFDELEAAMQEIFDRGGHKLIIDLERVPYIASAGIGVLMNAMAETRLHQGDLILVNLTPEVREVFDSLTLLEVFRIAENHQEAVSMLP